MRRAGRGAEAAALAARVGREGAPHGEGRVPEQVSRGLVAVEPVDGACSQPEV